MTYYVVVDKIVWVVLVIVFELSEVETVVLLVDFVVLIALLVGSAVPVVFVVVVFAVATVAFAFVAAAVVLAAVLAFVAVLSALAFVVIVYFSLLYQ